MSLTAAFLSQKGESLSSLYEKYKIRCNCYYNHHDLSGITESNNSSENDPPPSPPLVVLNYDNVQSPREELLVSECRGLVLEMNSWRIVARGMNRFFNQFSMIPSNSLGFNYEKFSLEVKEDGTYIHLFCYDGEWMGRL